MFDRDRATGVPFRLSNHEIVIPAKAGIHFASARAVARWIPAFAGMTVIAGRPQVNEAIWSG
jgi:hypothetical protein